MKAARSPHQILVHIIEARGVTGMDSSNVSDVYCQIAIGPTSRLKRITRTKFETVNTTFNETFVFEEIMLTEEEFNREKIALTLYDRNDFVWNKQIGGIEFSLDNVHRRKNHEYYRKWVPMTNPTTPGKENGFMRCSVYVLKRGDPTPERHPEGGLIQEAEDTKTGPDLLPPEIDRKVYILNCLVYRAEHVQATHGKSLNPFVSVRFNGNTCQTNRMATLSAPIWNRKMEIPFQLPLTSDSIEIQLWNHNSFTPDTLTSSKTLSYYEEGLTHRPWGPRWINLYSSDCTPPQVTFLGTLMDALQGGEQVGKDEYVGRILIRLSVKPAEIYLNPRLRSVPTAPAAEPEGETYCLDVGILSATEMPVHGGKLIVEASFGEERQATKPALGRGGTFQWNQVLPTIELFGTEQLSQVPDVCLNVYLKTGQASRKIAFLRIPVVELLDPTAETLYMLNGKPIQERDPWKPQWRALCNVRFEQDKSHIVAGLLMCWIGFGIKNHRPTFVPKETVSLSRLRPHTLRLYLHYATNLPAGEDSGLSDPFIVVRYAGRYRRTNRIARSTRYPAFYEMLEIPHVDLNETFAPSIQVLVYHKTSFSLSSHRLLGRCEISSRSFLRMNRPEGLFTSERCPLLRFPVKLASEDGIGVHNIDEMSITAQIEVLEEGKGGKPYLKPLNGWSKDPLDTSKNTIHEIFWKNANMTGERLPGMVSMLLSSFAVHIELVGVFGADRALSSTELEVSFADHFSNPVERKEEGEKEKSRKTFKFRLDDTGNHAMIKSFTFSPICVPSFDLDAVPLQFELKSGGYTVASCALPLSALLGREPQRPRLFAETEMKSGFESILSPTEVLEELVSEEIQAERLAQLKALNERKRIEEEERKKQSMEEALLYDDGEEGNDDESNAMLEVDGTEEDLEMGTKLALNDDLFSGNVRVETIPPRQGEADPGETKAKPKRGALDGLDADSKYANARKGIDRRDTSAEGLFHTLQLYRGRSVGLSSSMLQRKMLRTSDVKSYGHPQEPAGIVKCFIRAIPASEIGKGTPFAAMKEATRRYKKAFDEDYIIRVYVYRATDLAPAKSIMLDAGDSSQGCHPYITVENGVKDENKFTSRGQTTRRCVDLNPNFYTVVELPGRLPENGQLRIGVWDRRKNLESVGFDRLVGNAVVNLERRVFDGVEKGEQEWLTVLHPKFATSRGNLLVRVDVLTELRSRIVKADELTGPQLTPYEFRLVLWQTIGIKFPQEKDRVSNLLHET